MAETYMEVLQRSRIGEFHRFPTWLMQPTKAHRKRVPTQPDCIIRKEVGSFLVEAKIKGDSANIKLYENIKGRRLTRGLWTGSSALATKKVADIAQAVADTLYTQASRKYDIAIVAQAILDGKITLEDIA